MAGLSSLVMRPKPLGRASTRGLSYEYVPGVYSCGVVGGGGGGGGGSGNVFLGSGEFGLSGSAGISVVSSLFSRVGFVFTNPTSGSGGSYGVVTGSPGQGGTLARIQAIGTSNLIQATGGYGGGTDGTAPSDGYELMSIIINANSYGGRGWLFLGSRILGRRYGEGGLPDGVDGGPSGGGRGGGGETRVGYRIG